MQTEGLIRRVLVSLDMAAGQFGAAVPSITISARTGLALLRAQNSGVPAPLWALVLGAFLEIIDPGHLQSALVADFARATVVRNLIAGL